MRLGEWLHRDAPPRVVYVYLSGVRDEVCLVMVVLLLTPWGGRNSRLVLVGRSPRGFSGPLGLCVHPHPMCGILLSGEWVTNVGSPQGTTVYTGSLLWSLPLISVR